MQIWGNIHTPTLSHIHVYVPANRTARDIEFIIMSIVMNEEIVDETKTHLTFEQKEARGGSIQVLREMV